METENKNRIPATLDWLSWLYSGTAALMFGFALSALTGCRLGNKVEYPPSRYKITQYDTAPQSLTFCGTETRPCAGAATNLLPEDPFSVIITNPMVLIEDLQMNVAALVSSEDNSQGFDYSERRVFFTGETRKIPMWADGCETFLTGEITGQLDTTAPHSAKSAGRAELRLLVTRKFEGTACADVLYVMYQCYIDATKCPGTADSEHVAAQSDVSWLFGQHLQAGSLTPEEIPGLRSISYEVFYQ